jgi:putative transposase
MFMPAYTGRMARRPRIEYEGAVYHVMCRGDKGGAIFLDFEDYQTFLKTLQQLHDRTGFRIHAYALMANHYHLLLETPEANLVLGMKWFQGTYTQRFNTRHQWRGHLFQGRYKALVIENDPTYFSTVSSYIHLNPARAGLVNFQKGQLKDYPWSSFPGYIRISARPYWLETDTVLGAHGYQDDDRGRRHYREWMEQRAREVSAANDPWTADERWIHIRKGWYWGTDAFKETLLERMDNAMRKGKRESFTGEEVISHDEFSAEKIVADGMAKLGLADSDLEAMTRCAPEKIVLAWAVKCNTCVRNEWIMKRLQMGRATSLSDRIKNMKNDKTIYQKIIRKMGYKYNI